MKIAGTLWVVAALTAGMAGAALSQELIKEKSFSVTFPSGFPKASEEIGVHEPSEAVSTAYRSKTRRMHVAVSEIEYPSNKTAHVDPKKVLMDARDKGLSNLQGHTTQESFKTVSNFPALEMHFASKKLYGRLLLIVAKNRMYQLTATAYTPNELDTSAIDSFFKSFELK